jgi:tripartite-type tricarboxylate transporter receptor subunit TctC
VYAPKGTPNAAVDKLSAAIQESLKEPALRERMADLGATVYTPEQGTPGALTAHLKAEIDPWSPIIKAAGVYAD